MASIRDSDGGLRDPEGGLDSDGPRRCGRRRARDRYGCRVPRASAVRRDEGVEGIASGVGAGWLHEPRRGCAGKGVGEGGPRSCGLVIDTY